MEKIYKYGKVLPKPFTGKLSQRYENKMYGSCPATVRKNQGFEIQRRFFIFATPFVGTLFSLVICQIWIKQNFFDFALTKFNSEKLKKNHKFSLSKF